MENNLEHLDEDSHFKIRGKIQSEMIRDYFGAKDEKDISNEQAYRWLKPNAAIFDKTFTKVIEEYPSFWDDAEHDFDQATELIRQEFIKQENQT